MSDRLRNCRILLVEDEAIIALAIEDMLKSLGCSVVGPAYSVRVGENLAENAEFDAAILDVNLNGELSDRVAETLQRRGIPFCFSTGYGTTAVPAPFADRPVLQKPYALDSLVRMLDAMLG